MTSSWVQMHFSVVVRISKYIKNVPKMLVGIRSFKQHFSVGENMPLLALKKGNISSRVRDLVIRGSKILRYNIRSWQINNEDTLNACLMSNPKGNNKRSNLINLSTKLGCLIQNF